MKSTSIALFFGCGCLVVAMSTEASSKEKCDTMPQYDTVAHASALYQMAVDYFLTRSFCSSPRDGTIWCYFAPPSSIPMEEMCRTADSLQLELTKDWDAKRRLLVDPVFTMPRFTWPTILDALPGRATCDKAYYYYYENDRIMIPVVGTRGIIELVIKWLDAK